MEVNSILESLGCALLSNIHFQFGNTVNKIYSNHTLPLSFKGVDRTSLILTPQSNEDTVSFTKSLESAMADSIRYTETAEKAGSYAPIQLVGKDYRIATAGYFDQIPGYETQTKRFLKALDKNLGREKTGFVTSPSTASGSIDAITIEVSGTKPDRLFFVTAEKYAGCINPKDLPDSINKMDFASIPKHALPTPAEYSKATAEASDTFVAIGGRNTTVNDFCNAIKRNHKVVLVDNTSLNLESWNEENQRVDNASRYLKEQLNALKNNKSLPYKLVADFDEKFIENYKDKLLKNTIIVSFDGSDKSIENAAKEASVFLKK